MTRICLIAFLSILPLPVLAEPLPPGLQAARLLPGWIATDGSRMAALELVLEPGWKTYWRSPGDSGLPPEFDWSGSANLAGVEFHWPQPEAIASGDDVSLGFHDRLVLPFTARPAQAGQPVELVAEISLGLCERICVPAHLSLRADGPDAHPDPEITQALARGPVRSPLRPACELREIEDGMQVNLHTPPAPVTPSPITAAAIELAQDPGIWVSSVQIGQKTDEVVLTADLVPPDGKPFEVDTDKLRLTLIGPKGAVEMIGCNRAN